MGARRKPARWRAQRPLTSRLERVVVGEGVLLEPRPGVGGQVHGAAQRGLVLVEGAAGAQEVALAGCGVRAGRGRGALGAPPACARTRRPKRAEQARVSEGSSRGREQGETGEQGAKGRQGGAARERRRLSHRRSSPPPLVHAADLHTQRAASDARLVAVEAGASDGHGASVLQRKEAATEGLAAVQRRMGSLRAGRRSSRAGVARSAGRVPTLTSMAPPLRPQLRSKAQLVASRPAPLSSMTAPPAAGSGPAQRDQSETGARCTLAQGPTRRLLAESRDGWLLPDVQDTARHRGGGPTPTCRSQHPHSSRELPLTSRTLTRVSWIQGPEPYRMRPSCLASRMHSPPRVVQRPCQEEAEEGARWGLGRASEAAGRRIAGGDPETPERSAPGSSQPAPRSAACLQHASQARRAGSLPGRQAPRVQTLGGLGAWLAGWPGVRSCCKAAPARQAGRRGPHAAACRCSPADRDGCGDLQLGQQVDRRFVAKLAGEHDVARQLDVALPALDGRRQLRLRIHHERGRRGWRGRLGRRRRPRRRVRRRRRRGRWQRRRRPAGRAGRQGREWAAWASSPLLSQPEEHCATPLVSRQQ